MFLCGAQLSWAEDKTAEEILFEKVKKIGEIEAHYEKNKEKVIVHNHAVFKPKMYTESEIATMRKFLKRKIKYKIDGRLYTLTDDDLSVLPLREVIEDYISLKHPSPNIFFLRPYSLSSKEEKQKTLASFNTFEVNLYKKGDILLPLIPKAVIEKTNNLSLYLAPHTDDKGTVLTLDGIHGTMINRLRGNKEYRKKVDIIEDYYPMIDLLSELEITEIKENFALSTIGVSFALVLKKDFSEELYERYFHKLNDDDFVVVDAKKRKFYRLKDKKGTLLKVLGKILEKQ